VGDDIGASVCDLAAIVYLTRGRVRPNLAGTPLARDKGKRVLDGGYAAV
jgi:hypothetical protein